MKKVVITAVAVGLAAVAAQAQDSGAIRITSEVWGRYYNTNVADTTKQQDALRRALAKKVEKEQLRQAKQAQAKQNAKHFTHIPATGAMRDYAVEGRLQETTAAVKKEDVKAAAETEAAKQAKVSRPVKKASKGNTKKWLKAILMTINFLN